MVLQNCYSALFHFFELEYRAVEFPQRQRHIAMDFIILCVLSVYHSFT